MQSRMRPGISLVQTAGIPGFQGSLLCPIARDELLRREPLATDIAEQHRSRQLEASEVISATLILTASRKERDAVVRLAPAARERTFTMREAVALSRVVTRTVASPTSFVAVVDRLTQARGLGIPLPPVIHRRSYRTDLDWRDIPDAHVSKRVRHRHTLIAVAAAAEEIAKFLSACVDMPRPVDPRGTRDLPMQSETAHLEQFRQASHADDDQFLSA